MSGDDLLRRHLREVPAFRALLRATEGRFYADLMPLEEPVLDLGSGDGHFAAVALDGLSQPLTAGIDPDARMLREAGSRSAYRGLAQGLGGALPFGDGTFRTVVSNSVLEHIPEVEPVLAEVSRVLTRGGRLIFCVPSDHFAELLLSPRLLRRLRLELLARAYERYFNRISRHKHCDGPQAWKPRLHSAGFDVAEWFYYFSGRATGALEMGHYIGLPNLIARKLVGRWVWFPHGWGVTLTERWLRPLYEEPLPKVGAYLFFVAEKR